MKTSDFDYSLPPEFIAQTPVEPRDASRLLVLDRTTGDIEHSFFNKIGTYLHPGDLLVINRTRVIPARIFGRKPTGGRVEILLLHQDDQTTWECLVGGKGLSTGRKVFLENGIRAEIIDEWEGARRKIKFEQSIEQFFPKIGNIPLPPYIHEPLKDTERYQTVYARDPGSAAAPTAGLHFTPQLMGKLEAQGINFTEVTLHVGLDTFAPVTEEDPLQHQIHSEWCEIPSSTVDALIRARKSNNRIIAVGTTTVRTLESGIKMGGKGFRAFSGPTTLYILPGYRFKVIDAMITNFHLPKSTLIMLVSAFTGRDRILRAYEIAMQQHYRFYSFGDAMFIY